MTIKKESKILIIVFSIVGFLLIAIIVSGIFIIPKLVDEIEYRAGNLDKIIERDGGMYAEISPDNQDSQSVTKKELSKVKDILGKRLENDGIQHWNVTIDDINRILKVKFAKNKKGKISDLINILDDIRKTGLLTFRYVDDNKKDENGNYLPLDDKIILQGNDIIDATVGISQTGQVAIELKMNQNASKKFAEATAKLAPIHGKIAIFMDNNMLEVATVNEAITGGNAEISGGFTAKTAGGLAAEINEGVLPFKLKIIESEIK